MINSLTYSRRHSAASHSHQCVIDSCDQRSINHRTRINFTHHLFPLCSFKTYRFFGVRNHHRIHHHYQSIIEYNSTINQSSNNIELNNFINHRISSRHNELTDSERIHQVFLSQNTSHRPALSHVRYVVYDILIHSSMEKRGARRGHLEKTTFIDSISTSVLSHDVKIQPCMHKYIIIIIVMLKTI
jgi:hypothetical protein